MLRLRRSTSRWLSSSLRTFSVCSKRRASGRRRPSTPTSANSSKSTKKTHNYSSWRTSGTRWSRCLRMKPSWRLSRRTSSPVNRKRKKSCKCSKLVIKMRTTMTDMTRAKTSWTQLEKATRPTRWQPMANLRRIRGRVLPDSKISTTSVRTVMTMNTRTIRLIRMTTNFEKWNRICNYILKYSI